MDKQPRKNKSHVISFRLTADEAYSLARIGETDAPGLSLCKYCRKIVTEVIDEITEFAK